MILILGAGLAGISCSYHLRHERCLVLEKTNKAYGHIGSEQQGGFTWDQGPHVSFTTHDYVKQLFADSVKSEFDEYKVCIGNYYLGNWIDHPAQTSLHQIPEPLRNSCLNAFLQTRLTQNESSVVPRNYMEWLESSFGTTFANTFSAAYTRKYWTVNPSELTTSWIGGRVMKPEIEDVVQGSRAPLNRSTHYINSVRYPKSGGYESFAKKMANGCNIRYGAEVVRIDLRGKRVYLSNGEAISYCKLINTMPLPAFVNVCQGVPEDVLEATRALSCTQLLLVNVAVPHNTVRPENWIYVYDEDKLSTRINFTEKLTAGNAPTGWSGVQSEVYFSRYRPLGVPSVEVAEIVYEELCEMGLVSPKDFRKNASIPSIQTRFAPWANVIFTHETSGALDIIWTWLEGFGLERQSDDIHPLTDWSSTESQFSQKSKPCDIYMSGRFGQWKYFWSDDCVLRGRQVSQAIGV